MGESDSVTFGTLLRRHRLATGITQAGLAERAELSTDAIAALERGRRVAPRLETVARLATALDLNSADRAALISAAVGTPVEHAATAPSAEGSPSAASAALALPGPPITLLGREREETAVLGLLAQAREPGAARLISLIGPGGVGKTSLALQVGATAQPDYADGAVFVDLSPLGDPALVLPAIAQALALREAGDQGMREVLIAHLRDRQVLVVLDNAEQVIEAAPRIADLVAACPRLVVLVTSRVALRVRAEQRFRVPPLAIPPAGKHVAMDELADNPAVRLFVARAQAVELDFRLDAANAEAVAAICHRLDGLPLAIELAAARIALLSPRALLAQLTQAAGALSLLKGNARDLPARHRTLRATFEWSIGLLTVAEQVLLRALAVFTAGCTLEAAEAVCRADVLGDPIEDIFEGLASLVDKSLLRAEAVSDTETRFAMLRTIHDYARELLAASGERAILEQSHAAFFEALAADAEPALTGPEQADWLARLEREHNNLRAALQWTRDSGNLDRRVRLAGNLWRFWYTRGHLSEGRAWLEEALESASGRGEAVPAPDTAKARIGAGVLATMQGDYPRAAAHCEESLRLYRELNDRQGMAVALNILGNLAINQGLYDRALRLSEESLTLQRELGHQRGIALALNNLGFVVLQHGNYPRAEALCRESLELARALQDNLGMGWALSNLGDAAREQGEYGQALARYAEGIPLCHSMGSTDGVASCLEGIASVVGAQGRHKWAVRLCGAAAALRGAIGAALPSAGRAAYDQTLASARAALGAEEFAVAWETGHGLSEEQAIEEAMGGRVPCII